MSKYQIIYKNPTVKLLTSDEVNLAYNIWLGSREHVITRTKNDITIGKEIYTDEDAYKDKILKMGLQYSNFPTYSFEIQGSVLFRDVLFSINKSAQWATSLRFLNSTFESFESTNYPVSSEYKGIESWEDQLDKYFDLINKTMITDENRLEMPYSMYSKYWICMNFKTLITFMSFLKMKMPFFYNTYGKLIENSIKDIDITKYYVDYIDASIGQYLTTNNDDFKESFNRYGDTVILNKTMGLLLYSQFIRQQDTIIKGLFDMLTHEDPNDFKNKVFYASTPINVNYVSDISRFRRTISNRLCWFSMSGGYGVNSWSNILDLVIKDMPIQEFIDYLPCRFSNGCITCKYYEDIKFRKEGVEKRNLPCGIYYNNMEYCLIRDQEDKTILSEDYIKVVELLNGVLLKKIKE